MEQETRLYHPEGDSYFAHPYFDVREWREKPVRHYFVHGGFAGTEENGTEARFCFYFPEKAQYAGRFFQYLSPAPEDEHESETLTGKEDRILFALTHGAYYVISNQGGFQLNDPARLIHVNAQVAQLSRKVAGEVYGTSRRPYGYVYGGSGGSFKTLGCLEGTEGIWDGGIPYVTANPMAVPNNFSPRVRVMRLLGKEGLKKLVDATEPGGSGDILAGFTKEQQEAILEAHRMGFPDRAWFAWRTMGDGALMVLAPYIYEVMPEYFTDFWTKKGYAGADPDGPERRDRIQFTTTVREIRRPERKKGSYTDVDNSWQNVISHSGEIPELLVDEVPEDEDALTHCRIIVLTGEAAGQSCDIDTIQGRVIRLSGVSVSWTHEIPLKGLRAGDQIRIDNSDYIAMQTFQRHQVPDASYTVYDQYRNPDGSPKYPQLPTLLSPIIAKNGAGKDLTGDVHGKIFLLCSILDESAFPWHGDWYAKRASEKLRARGEDPKEHIRLYYNDHCLHGDAADELQDPQHQVPYTGILWQALLDLAAWCEKGKEPLPATKYQLADGQIRVPDRAAARRGLQPVVNALAEGKKAVHVHAGEVVHFTALCETPEGAGEISRAAWDYEAAGDWSRKEALTRREDGAVLVESTHVFAKPGTYFPVVKIQSSRDGTTDDIFVQCENLDRVRVIVE
ncbi:MAG: hypothetical protein ACI4OJ_01695 [Lachnospiraceae bacterium]